MNAAEKAEEGGLDLYKDPNGDNDANHDDDAQGKCSCEQCLKENSAKDASLVALGKTLNEAWIKDAQEMQPTQSVQEFKIQSVTMPFSRVKKIMKADPQVFMVGLDSALLLARACELFIGEVSTKGWSRTRNKKRTILRRKDIHHVVNQTEEFDFLEDVFDGTLAQERLDKTGNTTE